MILTADEIERLPICDNTPGGVLVEVDKGLLLGTVAELERLKKIDAELADQYASKCDDVRSAENALGQVIDLLKAAEWGGCLDGGMMGQCPWCDAHNNPDFMHSSTCPAAPWLKVDTGFVK